MSEMPPILQLNGIRKEFPGVVALADVDFDVRAGEVHALLGENGAGKSTLIKVMTGVYKRDAGAMSLDGKELNPASPGDAQEAGISTVYQEVNLLPNLSIAHNLFLGREPRRFGIIDWGTIHKESKKILARFNLDLDVGRTLSSCSVAVQQLVAIARGVSQQAKVLILDEPTASLDTDEVKLLFRILNQLKADGIGIVFVTHFLDQVYELSDRITVLRNGCKIGTFETANLPRTKLVEHMLGRELEAVVVPKRDGGGDAHSEAVLEAQDLTVANSIEGVSLVVRKGQAIGLAGLLGSGRTEVCRALFGIDKLKSGQIVLKGKPVTISGPAEALRLNIGLCPEDRKAEGIIGPLTIRENIVLALQARRGWWKPIPFSQAQEMTKKAIADLGIVTPDGEKPIEQLSGGNQQKVILARWLATNPEVLMLDEPTRGIDVGAHAEILKLIRALCDEGMALLVTSSELEELVAFSDEIAVMRDRKKVAELRGEEITENHIMEAIAQ